MSSINRRNFLSRGAGLTGVWVAGGAITGRAAVNDALSLAVIGFNGMGMGHVGQLAGNRGVRVTALCDVDPAVRQRGFQRVSSAAGNRPQLVDDFRRIVDDPNIDAVTIATPHHWHCPIAIPMLMAGKDVYVEKPASHVFREGRLLVDAAKKYDRVVQHGTQMRSSPVTREAGEVLKSGILGDIRISKAWNVQNRGFQKPVRDSAAPAGGDYDRWLGPAPKRAFNVNRFHSKWRLWRDYGNGDMGDDGAHDIDMAAWGLGVTTHPVEITAYGSNTRPRGYREYPDNSFAAFRYADGRVLLYEDRLYTPYGEHGVDSGNAFYGTEGYMVFSRRGFFRTYLGKKETPGPKSGQAGRVGAPLPTHMEDYVNAIRSRKATKAPAEVAHRTCALIHLAEIALRTKTVLDFDPRSETITNSKAANALLGKEYRHPYGLPDSV
ncbi:MAG: hypothetical protein CMJ59_04585 [Planctomycetaceae bacterium]|nr:hypothetical protein [Planctomycetaceae bacterium]